MPGDPQLFKKQTNTRGIAPVGVPYELRDAQLIYPIWTRGWIDIFKVDTVPINTNDFTSFTKYEVGGNFELGVLRWYGFLFISGDINTISFQFKIDGALFPNVVNTEYPGNVVVQPNELEKMHAQIGSDSIVEFFVKNTSAAQPAEVGVRTRGWHY